MSRCYYFAEMPLLPAGLKHKASLELLGRQKFKEGVGPIEKNQFQTMAQHMMKPLR